MTSLRNLWRHDRLFKIRFPIIQYSDEKGHYIVLTPFHKVSINIAQVWQISEFSLKKPWRQQNLKGLVHRFSNSQTFTYHCIFSPSLISIVSTQKILHRGEGGERDFFYFLQILRSLTRPSLDGVNTDKYHLLISGNKKEYMWVKSNQNIVWKSNDV